MKTTTLILTIVTVSSVIGCKNVNQSADQNPPLVTPKQQALKAPAIEAEDPADMYYSAWLLWRESEIYNEPDKKRQKIKQALTGFEAVQAKFPDWKIRMVEDRIQITRQALARLK